MDSIMTGDLTAFVTARLDEDEAIAKEAASRPGGPAWDDRTRHTAVARHINRHDPARALREVTAKRKRLAAYIAASVAADRYDDQYMAGVASGLADAIKDDADTWSDHPDYDQKWST
jgi:hypothetical protein